MEASSRACLGLGQLAKDEAAFQDWADGRGRLIVEDARLFGLKNPRLTFFHFLIHLELQNQRADTLWLRRLLIENGFFVGDGETLLTGRARS